MTFPETDFHQEKWQMRYNQYQVLVITLLLFSGNFGIAQDPKEAQVRFESAIDWLNTKLDYIYYDDLNSNWWNNSFYMNENQEVTIKQISSKTPFTANIKNKNYTIRKFHIADINPYTMEIRNVDRSMGRFVEGKLLEIRAFGELKNFHKTINNRRATSTSFLHLSFPKALTDTLTNYPEFVKNKLYEAVVAASTVYRSDVVSQPEKVLSFLAGSFQSDDAVHTWKAIQVLENVLKIEDQEVITYFGYDPKQGNFYLLQLSEKGMQTSIYQMKSSPNLVLENNDDRSQIIEVETKNSFIYQGVKFYRK
ncbi:MAG: hypothetical protein AAF616_15825 [Bacteroidota bacterium]